ncbi:hypothetical protein [Bacillus sp. Marseille-P3661]|uniref:hypothetical protein n=1 Tax=Bacillus sp. Marseille-P3661 TaxID=1936234 RepID=UPI000C85E068|nr:hypothetical protein [Bacillus sp. Marseille-P3661]
MLKILKNALKDHTLVEIIYVTKNGVISQRIIYVKAITENNIKSFCYLRKRIRIFKIENILAVLPYQKKVC